MSKNGHTHKLPDEIMVVLTEGDAEVCTTYVKDEQAARKLVEDWKNGTYKLLTE